MASARLLRRAKFQELANQKVKESKGNPKIKWRN